MHPRFARTLVNLAEIKDGEIIVDPFCGAGGILIEAAISGCIVIGIDIKKKLINGCKQNLEYYNITNYKLFEADMRNVILKKVDAVVTDFPYGRAAYLSDTMDKLYEDAVKKISEWTKKAVIGVPSMKYNSLMSRYGSIITIHCIRVHKSLKRFFYILKF